MIRDQIKFNFKCQYYHKTCLSCLKSDHTVQKCPYLHYIPDHAFLIRRFSYNFLQKRMTSKHPRKKKCFQSLKDREMIQEAAQRIESLESLSESFISSVEDDDERNDKFLPVAGGIPHIESSMEQSNFLNPLAESIKRKDKRASQQITFNLSRDSRFKGIGNIPGGLLVDEKSETVYIYIIFTHLIYTVYMYILNILYIYMYVLIMFDRK